MVNGAIRNLIKKVVKEILRRGQSWMEAEARENRKETILKPLRLDECETPYTWMGRQIERLIDFHEGENALRPHYLWGVMQGAWEATVLGINRIAVLELGVAGGNGLTNLERVAQEVEAILPIEIDVYGLDSGVGMPKPVDYRDLPNQFAESLFSMDVEKLKSKLTRARLLLGSVNETVQDLLATNPAPVAFIAFDLDYYSSTKEAFQLLEAHHKYLLPRIPCYFDDIMGFSYSEFTGERLAITEFNETHPMRKISPIFGLRHYLPPQYFQKMWPEQLYFAHAFDHPTYSKYDGVNKRVEHWCKLR